MSENYLKGILGVVLGATIWLSTGGCLISDHATGMTCSELAENQEEDVYFIVDDSDFNEEIWEHSHQNPETVRWNVAHTQFIVKYNAKDVPRDEVQALLAPNRPLGNPMSHSEILEELQGADWTPAEEVVKNEDKDPKSPEFATDDNFIQQ